MKTFTLKFYLKNKPNTSGKCPVYARIVYDRRKCEISTGIKCKPEEFSETSERFIDSKFFMNKRLIQVQGQIYAAHTTLTEKGEPFTVQDIKALLVEPKKSRVTTLNFYNQFIEDKIRDGHESRNTVAKYAQTLRYLEAWLIESEQEKLLIADFNLAMVTEFDHHLKQTTWNDKGDRLKLSSVNKHHSRLKAVLFAGFKSGLLNRNPYQDFKLSFPHAKREYLSKAEIERLKSLDLSNNKTLDVVRDLFLFSCYTGLRFADAQKSTINDIHDINGHPYLRIDQGKTDERREIPLLDPALIIIEKYDSSHEREVKGRLLPLLSNQKTNKYLKFLAEIAGIQKHLTHHVARHTCATTVLLDNDVPLETVSHWLGHNSVRTTQIYARISHQKLEQTTNKLNEVL